MNKYKLCLPVFLSFLLILTAGCSGNKAENTDGKLKVVATTTMLKDLALEIGGDNVSVRGLMGPGVDPHLYKPSEGDVSRMSGADLIIYHGLHLEGKMNDVFENMEKSSIKTFAAGEKVDSGKLYEHEGQPDPHLWFDVTLWKIVADSVRDALVDADKANEAEYRKNAENYQNRLDELHQYVKMQADKVNKEQRVLITAHDAFNYFGRQYGFEVKGLQGVSTAAEAGVADVQELASFIADRKIKAIFIESSVPVKSIEALQNAVKAKGFEVEIGGELFSDALGSEGTPEGTYIGMFTHNIDTISEALR